MKAAYHLQEATPEQTPAPKVVYTRAPVWLGTLIAKEDSCWRIRVGREEWAIPAAACVDPLLLEEALEESSRVVVDASGSPEIVGVIQTSRALRISREGDVEAQVERFSVEAGKEAVLKSSNAFVRLKGSEVELYGNRILTRAREVAKILARMIHLN
jgi:hypothetical protein